MQAKQYGPTIVLYLVMVASIFAISFQIERHHNTALFLAYFASFFCYLWLIIYPQKSHLYLGIIIRLVLFAGLPSLSDDIYRFIWDGHLLEFGINPFAELPDFYEHIDNIPGISQDLYAQLNSPHYFTIYPPLNQFIFWLSVQFSSTNWLLSAGLIRLILMCGDVIAFIFLRKILLNENRNPDKALIYFLNPLVILEGIGNIHFEVLVTSFLLIGIYYLSQRKKGLAGFGFGMAVATKLLPLIYFPALLFSTKPKWTIPVICIGLGVALLTFIPMFNPTFVAGLQESLGLYFQKFEFNASIYFLLREVGFWIKGYNIIGTLGPTLSLATFFIILFFSYFSRSKRSLPWLMFGSLMIYLSLSTIVHPWYIIPLIALGVIIEFKTAIVWSFFIFLTYLGYSENGFELSPFWIVLEYVIVFSVFIYELFYIKNEPVKPV